MLNTEYIGEIQTTAKELCRALRSLGTRSVFNSIHVLFGVGRVGMRKREMFHRSARTEPSCVVVQVGYAVVFLSSPFMLLLCTKY